MNLFIYSLTAFYKTIKAGTKFILSLIGHLTNLCKHKLTTTYLSNIVYNAKSVYNLHFQPTINSNLTCS